ncbi:unnamed protein product [Orchesella dallaii]|uniref:Replication protein A OB domain-containing protein n=1 Tax=Orchesella dallaii TaxID=48710 RepID=A0ABP1QBM7_9HEXA
MDHSGQRTMKALNRATWNRFRTFGVDSVYKLSNFTVNTGWNGGYPEILLGPYSHFEGISDEDFPPMPPFNLVPLKDLSSLPDDTRVDVLGIVTKVKDVVNNSATGVQRLEIYIDDDISKSDLSVIFWRDDASSFAGMKPFVPIIFRDAVKLTYCDEPTLHVKSFTQIWENSSNADARDLYERFEKAALEEGVELMEADEHAGESANK